MGLILLFGGAAPPVEAMVPSREWVEVVAAKLMKRRDTAPLTATLRGAGGAADLSGATVRFLMRTLRGETLVVAEDADNLQVGDGSDGTLGNVSYEWAVGETDEAGGYRAEWEVTYSDGSIQTFPSGTYNYIGIIDDNDQADS